MASLVEDNSTNNLGKTRLSSGYMQKSSCFRKGKKAQPHQSTPLRRSSRLMGKCEGSEASALEEGHAQVEVMKEEQCQQEVEAKYAQTEENWQQEGEAEKGPRLNCDYESLRNARISENKARMASLGLSGGDLLAFFASVKSAGSKATAQKKSKSECGLASPLRRSERLKGISSNDSSPEAFTNLMLQAFETVGSVSEGEAPISPTRKRLFATCCDRKDGGSFHDPILGICCHFCRQKKVCGEKDCKRCRYRDIKQPCIGKTECSVCHSSNGVLCRACLKVRYGEELDEVRRNKDWMCPHCIEEKGTNPFWICNSSICLKKRKLVPTGIAIFRARELGYISVAHLLMDQLKRKAGNR